MNSRLFIAVALLAALALLALIGLQRALEEAVEEGRERQPGEETQSPASQRPAGDSLIGIAAPPDGRIVPGILCQDGSLCRERRSGLVSIHP